MKALIRIIDRYLGVGEFLFLDSLLAVVDTWQLVTAAAGLYLGIYSMVKTLLVNVCIVYTHDYNSVQTASAPCSYLNTLW